MGEPSSCMYVPVRCLEKREEDFDLRKLGEYLGWKISQEKGDQDLAVLSGGDAYPILRLEMAHGNLVVAVLTSEVTHGSIAVLGNPVRMMLKHFIRVREFEEEVKSVVVKNPLGCYVMVKNELTIHRGEPTSDFLAAFEGNLDQAT